MLLTLWGTVGEGRLTCDEIEWLILAACFHDIGMVYDDTDKKKCFSNTNKCNHFLQKYYPEHFGTEFSELPDNIKQDYLRMSHPFPCSINRKNIISDGYEGVDFCLTMDQKHILELLTGENLYDSLQHRHLQKGLAIPLYRTNPNEYHIARWC